ncbi:MAG: PEP-CTERM sorting domain-containing protein [Planctomycetota bacterium]|nr:PEP-CTERM sorting domain-containing protein [Planctomycetota bacterium]
MLDAGRGRDTIDLTFQAALPDEGHHEISDSRRRDMHMRNSILVGLVVLAMAVSAQAETVYNFYFPVAPYAPWGNVGSAAMNPTSYAPLISPKAYTGDVWNTDTTVFHSWAETQNGLPFPETTLTSSDGLNTGVTVDITGNLYGHGFYKGGATPMPALQGGIFADYASTHTITFSGLGAGTKWEIYLLTCLNAPDQAGGFTFDGQTKVAAIWSTGAGHTSSNDSVNHWEEGYDYLHFAGSDGTGILAPTGTITGTWEGHSCNGFQLVQISSWPNYFAGDFNKDGEVGPEDFGILKDNFGLDSLPFGNHESWTLGDANDDGEIGPEDFGMLKDNFGLDGGPTGTYPLTNVPEPTALALLALAGLAIRRKQR